MRACVYLLETDQHNRPICVMLIVDEEFRDLEHLREQANIAKSERWVYRPGILFACIDGERVLNLS
jgi:hypothetical protein